MPQRLEEVLFINIPDSDYDATFEKGTLPLFFLKRFRLLAKYIIVRTTVMSPFKGRA